MSSVTSQALPSLVKYENATLVSNSKDKKSSTAKSKTGADKTQLAFTEEILNSILPPRYAFTFFSHLYFHTSIFYLIIILIFVANLNKVDNGGFKKLVPHLLPEKMWKN